jgi:hypothetical protein
VNELTQDFLDSLLRSRKRIVISPKKAMASLFGSLRNDMKVENNAGDKFNVFMRVSEAFQEDFSIGLVYLPPSGSTITIIRCNGPHGNVRDPTKNADAHHACFHIHRARTENIQKGRKPEWGGEPTKEYDSFPQALRYFLGITNIEWNDSHFSNLRQMELQFNDDDVPTVD